MPLVATRVAHMFDTGLVGPEDPPTADDSCGNAACPAGIDVDRRARSVVVQVVAEESALTAVPDPHMSGEREALAADREPDPPGDGINGPTGWMVGGGVVPAPLLVELIRGGAKVTPVWHPGDAAAESGYRPSAALERFIRCRDLTCRFPGCDRPAEFCDIDHTVPYPLGLTHPSNLKCVCRKQVVQTADIGSLMAQPLFRQGELVDVGVADPEQVGTAGQVLHIALVDLFGLNLDGLAFVCLQGLCP
jgi:Domain of unknown function (DUF222)